jgi:hypothetical protein
MKLNEVKTKFMVVNGSVGDKQPLQVSSLNNQMSCSIEICDKYTYLGSIFTADGKVISAIKEHAANKQKHLWKLVSFFKKNYDVSFLVKKKVFNACFISSLSYGCESWVNVNVRSVEQLYHRAVKALLCVRTTTANHLCLVELGLPKLVDFVKQRQHNFFTRMMQEREGMENEDPLMHVLQLVRQSNTSSWKYIQNLLQGNINFETQGIEHLQDYIKVNVASKSKFATYISMNETLESPPLYNGEIPEYRRISVTRLRLVAHQLKIETGRWSRLERDRRLCTCGEVQTERHVIEVCQLSEHVRQNHPNTDFTLEVITQCKDSNDAKAIRDVF